MIATDRFVYVHQPKTGGTFVSTALFRVHRVRWNWAVHLLSSVKTDLCFKTKYGYSIYNNNKHGGCGEIPARLARRVVLASVRSPYDLMVSQYEFGWWRRRSNLRYFEAVPGFRRRFSGFPDLSFEEFVELSELAFQTAHVAGRDSDPGVLTREFMHYYFKDKAGALSRFDDSYVATRAFEADMHPDRFLRQDRLNTMLHEFLLESGYDPEDVAFIPGMQRVLPGGKGRAGGESWERYYTPELKQRVRHRERLLFALFPEYDV
jgi:hypothetical protein